MPNSKEVYVTGATGNVGGAVIASLIPMGASVSAIGRDETRDQGLKEAGVEVVVGDLKNSETFSAVFMRGVTEVFLATPLSPDQISTARNGIAAAKRLSNPHVVRSSAYNVASGGPLRILRQHNEMGKVIRASGLP